MEEVTRKSYVVKHNLITEVYLMTVMETTTCFGLYWPSSGCLGNLRASYMHARVRRVEFPRQPDDGQYRPKHVVVSITVIKYTSVIKLCLTAYLFLVNIWTSSKKVKGKVIPLQDGVAQRVGRGIALLLHDRGTRSR